MKKLLFIMLVLFTSCTKEKPLKVIPAIVTAVYTLEVKTNAFYNLRYSTSNSTYKDTSLIGNFTYQLTAPDKMENRIRLGFDKATIAPIELSIYKNDTLVRSYFTPYFQYTISY